MDTKRNKKSVEERARDAPIEAYVNEGGGGKPKGAKPVHRGPLGVDSTDLTTAKQFDETRRSSHRR